MLFETTERRPWSERNSRPVLLTLSTTLTLMAACVGAEPDPELGEAFVEGHVSIDGQPAEQVELELLDGDSREVLLSGHTDIDGEFHFDVDGDDELILRVVAPDMVHEQAIEPNTDAAIELDSSLIESAEASAADPSLAIEAPAGGAQAQTIQTFFDWSGDVQINIHYASASSSGIISDFAVPVGSDEVLIGGGARINSTWTNSTFLSANYPNEHTNAWVASAKPHLYPDIYTLEVYAIGLKLNGVSAATLRNYVDYHDERAGGNYNHPPFGMPRKSNYYTLCGGIRVDSPNHLLFDNYYDPSNQAWFARAKSHGITSYSDASGYMISISKGYIPGFGYLDVGYSQGGAYSYGGGQVGVSTAYVPGGSVLACPGANINYSGAGRLLTNISPSGNAVTVRDKDLQYASSGTLQASATHIRKRP